MVQVGFLFGLHSSSAWDDGGPERMFSEVPALATRVEALGFDSVFFTEHHGSRVNESPSPFVAGAAAAAVTERVSIGSLVALPAYYHPLKLAEDVAVLDNISNGRTILGLGMGYRQEEFDRFGIDASLKVSYLTESLEIIRRTLAGERFDFAGRCYELQDAHIAPLPARQPVPLWLGASKRPGIERAARLGLPMPIAAAPLALAQRQRGMHETALAAVGVDGDAIARPVIRECFCAETDEEAWRLVSPYLANLYNDYRHFVELPQRREDGSYAKGDYSAALAPEDMRPFGEDRMLVGSPETLRAAFERHAEALPCDHWILRMHLPGMPFPVAYRSMELFSEAVLPTVRTLDVASSRRGDAVVAGG